MITVVEIIYLAEGMYLKGIYGRGIRSRVTKCRNITDIIERIGIGKLKVFKKRPIYNAHLSLIAEECVR